MAGKQAKTLTAAQEKMLVAYVQSKRYPERCTAMLLLSLKAGLRAKEIASITWEMVTDSSGAIADTIRLQDKASKGKSGRVIPMNKALGEALAALFAQEAPKDLKTHVIRSERGNKRSAHSVTVWFHDLFKNLGLDGCSSHSGRRTFGTNLAKKLETAEASLKDVQELLGHAHLTTTQRYIQGTEKAKKNLINQL